MRTRFERDKNGKVKDEQSYNEQIDLGTILLLIKGRVIPFKSIPLPQLTPILQPYAVRVGPNLASQMVLKLD